MQHTWEGIWAAWCDGCKRETGPLSWNNKCGGCDTDLTDAPRRGPGDPELGPDLLDDLRPRKEAA